MTEGPAAAPARERIVTVLATQLHQDRRSLLRGSAAFAGANLALAALAWAVPGGPLAWAVVVTAFLGSVFFALTVDWEFSRLTLWRREIARLGAGQESADAIVALLADPHTARPGRAEVGDHRGLVAFAPGADPGDGHSLDRPAVIDGGPTRGEGVS